MRIQCPSCKSQARLPDSKEGAKVRCGECGRMYLAVPPGARAPRKTSNSGLLIGIGVGVAALLAFVAIAKSGGDSAPQAKGTAEAPPPSEPAGADMGWNAETVQYVVGLYGSAHGHDESRLRAALHGPSLYAAERLAWAETAAEGSPDGEAPPASAPGTAVSPEEFLILSDLERIEHLDRWVAELMRDDEEGLVYDWRPYDGEIVEYSDDAVTLHVHVQPKDPADGTEKRTVEWQLLRDRGGWKVAGWERWYSPGELAGAGGPKGYKKVTLSDGSRVFEREPEPLDHLEDTPPELRERIDDLYATMIDLDLTVEATRARDELVEIGRPAIPILLTGLYETPLDTEENAIRANIIVVALRDITGEHHGYEPQVRESSGVGTTEERRNSSIKQWFAWWYRKQRVFDGLEEEADGLAEHIELSDEEKAWLERNKD